jgi:hypothetical protein
MSQNTSENDANLNDPESELAAQIKDNYLKRLEAFKEGAILIIQNLPSNEVLERYNESGVEAGSNEDKMKKQLIEEVKKVYTSYTNVLETIEKQITYEAQKKNQDVLVNKFYIDAAIDKRLTPSLEAFIKELKKLSSGKKFAMAESFWAWQDYKAPEKFEGQSRDVQPEDTKASKFEMQQTETYLDIPLTNAQIENIKLVGKEGQEPNWFKKLPTWAQTYFKERFIITQQNTQEITLNSEKLNRYKPATLRGVPGIVNTTEHSFSVTVNKKTITTKTYRQGVPVPYDMPEVEQLEHTIMNLEQVLQYHQKQGNFNAFNSLYGVEKSYVTFEWADTNVTPIVGRSEVEDTLVAEQGVEGVTVATEGSETLKKDDWQDADKAYGTRLDANDKETDYQIYGHPITHISLLSGTWEDSRFFITPYDKLVNPKDNNTKFINQTKDSLAAMRPNSSIDSFNIPVNSMRPVEPKKIDTKFIQQMTARLNKLEKLKASGQLPTELTEEHIAALKKVIESMKHHNGNLKNMDGRNPNLFSAGLMMAAVRLSGGIVVSNCKSGKDREGAAILMADSIIAYSCRHENAPKFDDGGQGQGQARGDFLDIQEKLYLDGAHQAVAFRTSPGSGGLKDEGFFEKDFVKRPNVELFHKVSKSIADNNKPESDIFKTIWKDKKLFAAALLGVVGLGVGIGLALSGFALPIALPVIGGAIALILAVIYKAWPRPEPLHYQPKNSQEDAIQENSNTNPRLSH